MIKTSLVLLAISAIIAAIVYYRFPKHSLLRPLAYTGAEHCKGCHDTHASGNQYGIWAASAHAAAYTALRSDSATQYAAAHKLTIPAENPACLHCHTTAYNVTAEHKAVGYRPDEGVSCEQCHGPGSDYGTYNAMKDKKLFVKLGGIEGAESDCIHCHALSLHAEHCPFQTKPFDLIHAMQVIAHPIPTHNDAAPRE